MASLASKDVLPPPVEDHAAGADYCATKGQASTTVRAILNSQRFLRAASQRSADAGRDNAGGTDSEGAQQQHGSAAGASSS